MSNQHVVPRDSGWAVIAANAEQASALFDTKQEAEQRAKINARNQNAHVVVHAQNGQIQSVYEPQEDESWKDIKIASTGLRPRQHVVPHDEGWAVISEGAKKPEVVKDSKYAAIKHAHLKAQDYGSTLIVHNEDGTFSQIDQAPHYPGPLVDLIKSA